MIVSITESDRTYPAPSARAVADELQLLLEELPNESFFESAINDDACIDEISNLIAHLARSASDKNTSVEAIGAGVTRDICGRLQRAVDRMCERVYTDAATAEAVKRSRL